MKAWKTLNRQTVFYQPPWLIVEEHAVQLPDGQVIPRWPWVITPDYVNVIVETERGEFLCFNQTKYALQGDSLAIIGGYLFPDEAPLAAAQRELREETGYAAEAWTELGHYQVDPNRGIATGHLYLARQARQVTTPVKDDLEEQHLISLSRMELETALSEGKFKVMAWAAAVAFALRYLPPP